MLRPAAPVLTGAVEGDLDEVILRRVVEYAGLTLGTVHGRRGKQDLLRRLPGYNLAAQHASWIVLVDLDQDGDCAPFCRRTWLRDSAPGMCFSIAVRAAEAWLLADRERIARLLRIRRDRVPRDPDRLDDPKRAMIDLARSSSNRAVLDDVVPREGSGRSVGPGYVNRMIHFVQDTAGGWQPHAARMTSESLSRCIERLYRLRDSAS